MIKTRFAPAPTGFLHVGNVRTAIINFLFAKKEGGLFYLRIDDTDPEKCKQEYIDSIKEDLSWLGIEWDETFNQSQRFSRYYEVLQYLIEIGRLYPCYETQEELELKRKLALSSGRPPIYDRASLKLTDYQIREMEKEGRKPHYRFLIRDEEITWNDMVKGKVSFQGAKLGDPILVREDGSMTYMICSVIDDIDYEITHIIRGEDHITNTAIQIQMFEALSAGLPTFGHLSLLKTDEQKISKRKGGFTIQSLKSHIEPEPLFSMLATIGSSHNMGNHDIKYLVENFNIGAFSKSAVSFSEYDLLKMNHKYLSNMPYEKVSKPIPKDFWYAIRSNITNLNEVDLWYEICKSKIRYTNFNHEERSLLSIAAENLPNNIDQDTWGVWTRKVLEITHLSNKKLYLPLRLALTGLESGPELGKILPLIPRDEIICRLVG